MKIQKILWENAEKEYADFQAKLTPTVERDRFMGIRVPRLREIAKEYYKNPEHEAFLKNLPHEYYDEYMLHGMLISHIKDYDACILELDKFLPYVDNWAVCDTMSPKVFKKNKDKLLEKIKIWAASEHTYVCRFGISMLMKYYLDADFKAEYLNIPASVISEEYYVNMMIAWFMATALAKQWKDTVKILEANSLSQWVHNKTIQKARESYRITEEQKEYLKTLRR